MGNATLLERFKELCAGIGWALFLWGIGMTENQYIDSIYRQEKSIRQGKD